MIIYKATNKVNGKMYIGQTILNLKLRICSHKSRSLKTHENDYFHSAIKKYGINKFKWKIIEKCDTKEELDEMEFHYIKQYNTFAPNGYNLTMGGDGTVGYKWTEKQKIKIEEYWTLDKKIELSEKRKGKNNPMYGKCGEDSPTYGMNHTEETKQKISEKATGRKQSNEMKEAKSEEMIQRYKKGWVNPMLGKKNKARSNMNKQNIGDKNPFYGRKHTEETKIKMSKPRKIYDDEIINKIIKLRKKELIYDDIADIMDMPSKVIGNICRSNGIKIIKKVCMGSRKYSKEIRDEAFLMRSKNYSWNKISLKLNISKRTIRHWFDKKINKE